jgi:hypothetical protein
MSVGMSITQARTSSLSEWALLACCGEVLGGAGMARPSDNGFVKGRTSGDDGRVELPKVSYLVCA